MFWGEPTGAGLVDGGVDQGRALVPGKGWGGWSFSKGKGSGKGGGLKGFGVNGPKGRRKFRKVAWWTGGKPRASVPGKGVREGLA